TLDAPALIFVFCSQFVLTARAAEPVAQVNGEVITAEELENALGAPLAKLQRQVYDLKRRKLETMIEERLLTQEAARRGLSVAALLDAEVTAKVPLVTEQEIEIYYQANKDKYDGEEANARTEIRGLLQNQKLTARRRAFLGALRREARVVVQLEPPPIFRLQVPTEGAPALGSESAPVTIVKFEDFQCPYCRRAQVTLRELKERYGDKLRIVHRDFPIENLHPGVTRLHYAAHCAQEQGKFWEYQDTLYTAPARATDQQLAALAAQVGLDRPAFESCLASGKHESAVKKDFDLGVALGVTGTPAFFINGRLLSGAHPIERFIAIIDEELSQRPGDPNPQEP
ncbi:MAG: thioredoxin domain-containing protein, partial [Terriglobales bacterium]